MPGDVEWTEGDPVPEGYVLSRTDNLPARDQGIWARDKLRFLRKYLPGAVGATKKKQGKTYYLDLYAGPGRNAWVDEGGDYEDFPGSPLIALDSEFEFADKDKPTGFGHYHFCNISDRDHELLSRRVDATCQQLTQHREVGEVHLHYGDSNEEIFSILDGIPERAYIAVFLDIQGPSNLAFRTVEALKANHDSVDVYVLYPTHALRRILPYDPEEREQYRDTLNQYFGTDKWEPIVERRKTEAQARRMDRELRGLYQDQLRKLWEHVDVPMSVTGPKGLLYHMIFAYDHPAAGNIADSAAKSSAQGILFDQPK